MTKAELIESVASKVDLPRAVAERAVNTMFEDIVEALKQGDKVNVSGFRHVLRFDPEGPNGTEPQDRRKHRDLGFAGGEVQGRQDSEGLPQVAGDARRHGRLAQRESIGLTSRGSSVQIGYRP